MINKIGIIGFGNMGSSLATRLKTQKNIYEIWVFDKDKDKIKNLLDINIAENNTELVNKVDTVVLAVKPQDFDIVLDEIKDHVKEKLIISIAAGITTAYIEKYLGCVRVVRTMPNMAVKIGKGMACLCKGRFATREDLNFTKHLFKHLGETLIINENMMDKATAISGSGPGYYFDIIQTKQNEYRSNPNKVLKDFIRSLTEAAISIGFSKEEAKLLASTTGSASELLLKKTKLSPNELKKQITSKGGTTEAGLKALHKRGSLVEAAKAALRRAQELSRKE